MSRPITVIGILLVVAAALTGQETVSVKAEPFKPYPFKIKKPSCIAGIDFIECKWTPKNDGLAMLRAFGIEAVLYDAAGNRLPGSYFQTIDLPGWKDGRFHDPAKHSFKQARLRLGTTEAVAKVRMRVVFVETADGWVFAEGNDKDHFILKDLKEDRKARAKQAK